MRTKEEIMKEVGDVTEHPTVALSNVNEYLFLEVLIDIRDQIAELIRRKDLADGF